MTERPSIVVVSPYRREYGPRRVLEHVAEAIELAGFSPVLAVPAGADLGDELRARSGRIETIPGLGTIPRTVNPLRLAAFLRAHLRAARAIASLAESERAVAVYTTSEATFCGSLAARRLQLPSVIHAIGMSINRPRLVAASYIRFLNRITDMFIACSAAVAEMFAAHGVSERKTTVVHNGIDAASVARASIPLQTLPHTGRAVGMVAAYDSRKGHELFVDAAALIAQRHPDARFYIIGGVLPGQDESARFEQQIARQIEQLGIEDRFERVGYLGPPDVYRWVRRMDVVVVPSRTEAFAHALLEAMACERPIVASAVEGNLDALVDGHSGVYVERRADDLAAAVDALLTSPARAKAMGVAAGARVASLFDVHVVIAANAELVRELLRPLGS